MDGKSDFVERLTHDSFVVQVERISSRYQTRLDKLLSVFEQRNFVDDSRMTKSYDYTIDEENVKVITEILEHTGADPKSRREIETEQEAWRSINALIGDKEKELATALQDLDEKDKVIDEKEKVIDEKDKVIDEKDRLIAELKQQIKDKL